MILNESTIDRTVRVLLGSLILLQFFIHPASPHRHWALIGLMPVFTGLIGYCPGYCLFGRKACRREKLTANDAKRNRSTDP